MAYTVTNDPWKSEHSVLIGTETETARLSVQGVPDGNNYTLYLTDGANNGFTIQHATGEVRQLTPGSADMVFSPDSVEKMRLDTDGKLGIGASSPLTALHVVGTIYAGATESNTIFDGSASGQVNQNIIGSNGYWSIRTATNKSFNIDVFNTSSPTTAMTVLQDANVGIGTNSPENILDVSTSLGRNRFSDNGHVLCQNKNNDSTNYWTFAPRDAGYMSIGYGTPDGAGTVGSHLLVIETGGDVGIGTTSPSYALEVSGTFYSSGSSMDYKQEVQDYKPDADAIMNLRPVHYEYIDDYKHFGKRLENNSPQIGLVAEEVAEVMPELAVMKEEDGKDVVRNVDYEKLTVVLLSELQELKREVKALKEEN